MNAALLLTALFNGAWQGAILCALAYAVLKTQRRLNATTIFAVWSILLAIALALPVANYVFAARPYTVHITVTQTPATVRYKHFAPVERVHHAAAAPLQSVQSAPKARISPREAVLSAATWLLDRASLVLLLLGGIALVRLLVLGRDLAGMFAARRAARRIDLPFSPRGSIGRRYDFAASSELKSPCVLGFSPALIVIPEDLLAAPEQELLSVVLHEREHVRRYDDVQNVLHRAIGAVAFFCPGVRIALRELALYREQICDDAAVNGTGDAISYAMTLTGMAQWAQGRGVPVPSLIFKRKQLLHRLEVLLDKAVNHSLKMNRRFAAVAATALLLAAAIVLRVQVPVIAKTVEQPKPPAAPASPAPVRLAVKPVHHVPAKPKAVPKLPASPKPKAPVAPARLGSPPPAPARHAALAPRVVAVAPAGQARLAPVARIEDVRGKVAAVAVAPPAPGAWAPTTPVVAYAPTPRLRSEDLLDALQAAGIRNLSVDQMIALRDHGVNAQLVQAAVAYFGSGLSADELVTLADHGVSSRYLEALRQYGVSGIPASSVVMLADHGVNTSLVRAANSYFGSTPPAANLVMLSDHGVSPEYLYALRDAGARGIPMADVIRLRDHGVDPSYIIKVRRYNPRASIDDIIRLRDSGF